MPGFGCYPADMPQIAHHEVIPSPIGSIGFCFAADGALVEIDLPYKSARRRSAGPRPAGAPGRAELRRWLTAFCRGEQAEFPGKWRLPKNGTFAHKVWREVHRVRPGAVRTYQEIAARCGSPRAARAVGNAMNANPLPLLIPCHRVIASQGLGGFGGGLTLKKRLLALENADY